MKSAFPLASLVLLAAFLLHAQPATSQPSCADWQTCRDLAEQARAAEDFETFHDLAWRAVQTRGRRDPELFFLLARAQSLSGRPHDALVTLQRLAEEMHVAKDVSADEDFRRVRALPGWPGVEAIIAGEGTTAESSGGTSGKNVSAEASGGTSPRNPPSEPSGGTPSGEPAWTEVARFTARSLDIGGLAYDAVSRRFVIGNIPPRKLTVVEEGTNRAATLSGSAAQLLNVRALEIDRRQGDLWVVSEGSRDEAGKPSSELHKLQLVSGRVLNVYAADPAEPPSRFMDVAVAPGNGVLVLDAAGPRVLRPSRNGEKLLPVLELPAGNVTSLAPTDDGRTVYVAYDDHVARIDVATGHVARVSAKAGSLGSFSRFRWHKGSLVGAQSRDGQQRIVQVRLGSSGSRVVSVRTLDRSGAPATPLAALDVLEDDFFYLVAGEPEASIRRIRLK